MKLALVCAALACQIAQAKDDSKPIVDARIDAAYRQVVPSDGDEWAPTWGRDDVLYTGNDDGSSFGGIPRNVIAFGKLEGSDPNKLKGTSINSMEDFREPPLSGPENALWQALATYRIDGVYYRFAPCASQSARSNCLEKSSDQGKSWSGGKPLFQAVKGGAPFFIAFDRLVEPLLGGKAGEYAYVAFYAGLIEGEDRYIIARALKTQVAQGNDAAWSFQEGIGTWRASAAQAKPADNQWGLGPDKANWKTMNTYSVDGVLYMFVTRCHYPMQSDDPKGRHIFESSSIIKSTDNGRTWARTARDNFEKPMFPGKRFGTAYFVWYGKDGAASVDNAARYVYAVSNNGHFENGDDYIIGRVLRSKLAGLSAADWSFYVRGDGLEEDSWTADLQAAKPVLVNPGRAGMTGMTYVESLRRYVMVPWHYNRDNFVAGIKAKDLSTVVELFEAPKPWGPWTKVKEFETGKLGWYAPIIGQRFQKAAGAGTTQTFLYATGFFTKPEGGLDSQLYKLNYMPLTLSTQPLKHKVAGFAGGI